MNSRAGSEAFWTWLTSVVLSWALATPGHTADSIKIGVVSQLTGSFAEFGQLTTNGVKLAQDEINQHGGVLGRQIELRIEDTQSTNPGTVLAFSRLFADTTTTAVIGPIFSSQIQAASPTIAKAGVPTMIGGAAPVLTKLDNPWVFRARPHDGYSARVMADFGVNALHLRKWAIVYSTDAYGAGGNAELNAAIKALGLTPVLVEGYTPNSQDYTAIALTIKRSGADVLGTYMGKPADVAIFAKQLKQLGVNVTWIGSQTNATTTALALGGEALHGTYIVADFSADANDQARAFASKYRQRFGTEPDVFSSWAYDAMNLLALAISNARTSEAKAIRDAVTAIKNYKGVEGTYEFDASGEGLHGCNVLRNEGGRAVFARHIDFPSEQRP